MSNAQIIRQQQKAKRYVIFFCFVESTEMHVDNSKNND